MGKGSHDDLVERLSAATVGSRELDAAAWAAVNGFVFVMWDGAGCVYRNGISDTIRHEPAERIAKATTSLDAALALAERVHDRATALVLLLSVIDLVGENDWPSSRIPTLYCAATLKALPTQPTDTTGEPNPLPDTKGEKG